MVQEFDFGAFFASVDPTIREEVRSVADVLLEECHSLDHMEEVGEALSDLIQALKAFAQATGHSTDVEDFGMLFPGENEDELSH